MGHIIEPKTERLRLRQWQESDFEPFAVMSSDSEVMRFFPQTLNRSESDAIARFCQSLIAARGWGVWAVELKNTREFIGMVGLHIQESGCPGSPCVEILWRLARPYWGHGYASEAAAAALRVGFEQLDLQEIVSFAVPANGRSRAVMERLSMTCTGETFLHPEVPENSNLREHCVYRISREAWLKTLP